MKVIFLYGPPGVGKFTIGNELSLKTGLPLFHNHLVVDMLYVLFQFGSTGFKTLRESIWFNIFEVSAKEKKSFIFTFCPENTVDPKMITRLESVVEKHDGKIFFIELTADYATLAERIDNQERAKFGKLTDLPLFKELTDQGVFTSFDMPKPFLTIDATHTPIENASKIIDALKSYL
ncbi:MAG: AAA family ATPase [Bacteriovoracaceae bacterium]|nr:AAA family ATPase [Bacteriovoracaceae bacterium]